MTENTEDEYEQLPESSVKRSYWSIIFKIISFFLLTGVIMVLSLYWYATKLNEPTENFPVNQSVSISPGTGVKGITKLLAEKNVVQSDTLLYYVLVSLYDPTQIKASTYVFDEPLTTIQVAERLTQGDFDTDLIRFTHYEGERATHIAKRASQTLPKFDLAKFVAIAEPKEGRLFPETYFIPPTFNEEDLLSLMLETFAEKTASLTTKIASSSLTENEILILASIIEREADTVESKKMVSSVLQNRLAIDMPLQADASIEYILDKPLSELTPEDLKTDTPYNTYLYKGLPPTPIGNPGLDAIMAVLEPAQTEYLFYITDDEGNFYYAKTYKEHLKNIQRYLR